MMASFEDGTDISGAASAYQTEPAASPAARPEAVQVQSQRNEMNAARQAQANAMVDAVKTGLKTAAIAADGNALPNTRELARRLGRVMTSGRESLSVLEDLPRYIDGFA
jgi:23S rRNA pseudoU1915 N3-methylase RlmH